MSKPRVVIVGGGFGGVFTARHLQRLAGDSLDVELINAENYFVFQPLLPEVASGTINAPDAVSPLRALLRHTRIRMAEVTRIDTASKRVHLLQGSRRIPQSVPYDYLVLAVGQKTNLALSPGFEEHSLSMRDLGDAHQLRNQIIRCLEHADITENPELKKELLTFVVAGGGFSGVETIGEVVEMIRRALKFYPNIDASEIHAVLVQKGDRILPELDPSLGAYAKEKLQKRQVKVVCGRYVSSACMGSVTLDNGDEIKTHTLVTTVGNSPRKMISRLGVDLNRGKICVNRALEVEGTKSIWALGDAALIPLNEGEDTVRYAPPTAQYAVREARCVAGNICKRIKGEPADNFAYTPKGSLASIGNYKAVAELYGFRMSGLIAWVMWRGIYIGMLPGFSTRLRVALNWLFDYFLPRSVVQIANRNRGSSQYRRYSKGDVISEPGQRVDGFYSVLSGCLESRVPGEGQAEDFVRILGPGDHWGERSLSEHSMTVGTLTALEDSRVMVLPAQDFRNLCEAFPALDEYFDGISDKIYAPSLRRKSD